MRQTNPSLVFFTQPFRPNEMARFCVKSLFTRSVIWSLVDDSRKYCTGTQHLSNMPSIPYPSRNRGVTHLPCTEPWTLYAILVISSARYVPGLGHTGKKTHPLCSHRDRVNMSSDHRQLYYTPYTSGLAKAGLLLVCAFGVYEPDLAAGSFPFLWLAYSAGPTC